MVKIKTLIKDIYSLELSEIAKNFLGSSIFYCESNKELEKIAYNLPFFTNIKTIIYPEWDCDFYDSNSASKHVLTQRIKALYQIMQNYNQAIILTTPKAVTPLTIPFKLFEKLIFCLKNGQITDIDIISQSLTDLGFNRVNNAVTYGDYAIRGDIVDIANIDSEIGYRLDIFGNIIEKIKYFDLSSQSSTPEIINSVDILPIDEIIINTQTLLTFAKNTSNSENINHKALCEGIKTMNYMHYLPFFYDRPSSFFDFFKTKYQIIISDQSESELLNLNKIIQTKYNHSLKNNKYSYPKPSEFFTFNNQ